MLYEMKNIFIISLVTIQKYNIFYFENYMDKDTYTNNTGLFKMKYTIFNEYSKPGLIKIK